MAKIDKRVFRGTTQEASENNYLNLVESIDVDTITDSTIINNNNSYIGPSLIENQAFITVLTNDANWNLQNGFTSPIPTSIEEGDYVIRTGTGGDLWKYTYSEGKMFRTLYKTINAFLNSPPDISGVTFIQTTPAIAYGALPGINQGDIWTDLNYAYISFADNQIVRIGSSGSSIVNSINTSLGSTVWQTGGGGGGGLDFITDVTFQGQLRENDNWVNEVFQLAIPANTPNGSILFAESISPATAYLYWVAQLEVGDPQQVFRMPLQTFNAFLSVGPDVSSVVWNDVGIYSVGVLIGVNQGDIWQDESNGYIYIAFEDDQVTRIGGSVGSTSTLIDDDGDSIASVEATADNDTFTFTNTGNTYLKANSSQSGIGDLDGAGNGTRVMVTDPALQLISLLADKSIYIGNNTSTKSLIVSTLIGVLDIEGLEVKFGEHPNTRNDGGTTIAFYPDINGNLRVGPITAGAGDALVANPLSQFAATTSAQLAGVISDETGTGSLVFSTSPTLVNPALGTPASGVATNLTGTAAGLTAGTVTTNANLTGEITSTGNAAVLDVTSISNKTLVTAVPTDMLLIQDATDGALKRVDAADFFDGAGDVFKTGTPTNGRIALWTDSETIGGDPDLVFTGTSLDVVGADLTLSFGTGLYLNGSEVLSSGSGTISLSNVTTIDTITEATIENAIDTLPNLTTATNLGITASQISDNIPVTKLNSGTGASASTFWRGDGTWSTPGGGGDALTTNPLSQFAATTSAQLLGVISDETGTGSLVFATSPTLVTPSLGVATATSINGATITSGTLNGSVTGTNTGDQTTIVGITGTKAQFDTAVTDGNIMYVGDAPTVHNHTVSEITDLDADLATFNVPASTTISAFGATLVDDVDAATARTTLGVDAAGTDNSTDVTLAGTPNYLTLAGQAITLNKLDITDDTNLVGGTGLTLTTNTLSVDASQTQITGVGTLTVGNADAIVSAASDTVAGKVELATSAEVDTGTDATRAITPDSLAGSVHSIKYVQAVLFDYTTDVAVGDGAAYIHIPPAFNGMNLVYVHAQVITAGTTGTTDIQVHNLTQAVDMLTTKLTIDSAETGSHTAATPAVIDTVNDDVATNDIIRLDGDAISTTAPKGLIVTLGFQLP